MFLQSIFKLIYFKVCSAQERADVIASLREVCVHILHSHDGSRVARECFWFGTSKDRKAIIKTFKTFVTKISTEEHGHLVMLSIFDTVDDTKLVSKAILEEMATNLEEIFNNENGRKVLMYLMAPRDTTYFHPDILNMLKKGDGNEHSKKDAETRRAELKSGIAPALNKHVLENMNGMFYDNPATIFLTCILNNTNGAMPLLSHLADECAKPFVKGDDEPNLIETTATHKMLKKIIAHDKKRAEKGEKTFSELALNALDDEGLESWISCNRGCFLLLNMWETELEQTQSLLKTSLQSFKKTLKASKFKGAELLRNKVNLK